MTYNLEVLALWYLARHLSRSVLFSTVLYSEFTTDRLTFGSRNRPTSHFLCLLYSMAMSLKLNKPRNVK